MHVYQKMMETLIRKATVLKISCRCYAIMQKEKGFIVVGEYVDDGYSGTTFNRPDLNRMIKDAMEDTEPSELW